MPKTLKKKWLNLILHISSLIYKKKVELLSADELKVIWLLLQLLFLQFAIIFLNFPSYFIINKADVELNFTSKKELKAYYLRSKLALAFIGIIVFLTFLKIYFDSLSWYK